MELVPVHRVPEEWRQNVKDQCGQILNSEWPRSQALRARSLDSSRDDLPACLALVQWLPPPADGGPARHQPGPVPCVLGHLRMTRIPSRPDSVWFESVVLHPDLRGRGLGKYLMLVAEDFARGEFGFRRAFLNTIDRQAFYSCCGYSFCDPVTSYGGNLRVQHLPLGSSLLATNEFSTADPETEGKGNPDPETAAICAKIYATPNMPGAPPVSLTQPLRQLDKDIAKARTEKKDICRAVIPKDFMMKWLQ